MRSVFSCHLYPSHPPFFFISSRVHVTLWRLLKGTRKLGPPGEGCLYLQVLSEIPGISFATTFILLFPRHIKSAGPVMIKATCTSVSKPFLYHHLLGPRNTLYSPLLALLRYTNGAEGDYKYCVAKIRVAVCLVLHSLCPYGKSATQEGGHDGLIEVP